MVIKKTSSSPTFLIELDRKSPGLCPPPDQAYQAARFSSPSARHEHLTEYNEHSTGGRRRTSAPRKHTGNYDQLTSCHTSTSWLAARRRTHTDDQGQRVGAWLSCCTTDDALRFQTHEHVRGVNGKFSEVCNGLNALLGTKGHFSIFWSCHIVKRLSLLLQNPFSTGGEIYAQ